MSSSARPSHASGGYSDCGGGAMPDEHIDPQIFAVLTGFFFALVAHHLTIGRDRRREFNEIAIPLRAKIRNEAESPSPSTIAITSDDADAIASRLWWHQRRGFLKCCEDYWRAHKQQHQDNLGQPFHTDENAVRKAAKQLLKKIPIR